MRRCAILVLFLIASTPLVAEGGPFEVDSLLDGVWLFRVPANSVEYTNSLVVDRDHGLLVVESQPSPAAARKLLEAIRRVSDKPVRYLVLSHPHVESSGGASAFPESTLVIAGTTTYDALKDETSELGADIPLRLGEPDDWTAPPRVLPALVVPGNLSLTDGKHRVELIAVPRGHYPGAVVLHIKEHAFFYVGAMATNDRNPHADSEHTNVGGWVAWINSLLFARPETIVPLRGEPLDVAKLRTFRDALSWLVNRVEHAMVERVPKAEIVEFVMSSEGLADHFDVDADPFFARGLVERAVDWRTGRRSTVPVP